MTNAELCTRAIQTNYLLTIFWVCISWSIWAMSVLSCVSGRRHSSTASNYWNHLCKCYTANFLPHTSAHTSAHTHSRHYGPLYPVSVVRLVRIGVLRGLLGTTDQLRLSIPDLIKASPPLYSSVPPHTHTHTTLMPNLLFCAWGFPSYRRPPHRPAHLSATTNHKAQDSTIF